MSIFSGIKFNIPEDKREKEAQTGTSLFSGIKFNVPKQEPKPTPKSPMQVYLEQEKQQKLRKEADEAKKKSDWLNSPLGTAIETIKGLPAAAKQMFVEIPAREAVGAKIQGTGGVYEPKTAFEKFLLGKEPVKELSVQGQEVLEGFGVKKETAEKWGLPLGGVFLATDMVWPGGKTSAVKALTKVSKSEDVLSLLTKAGVAEDIAKEYAPVIAKAKTEKAVGAAVDAMENLQKQTKAVQAVKPAQPLDNLAQEARKYKTAEEFVKAQSEPIYHQTKNTESFNKINQEGFNTNRVSFGTKKEHGLGYAPKNAPTIEGFITDKQAKIVNDTEIYEDFVNYANKKGINTGALTEYQYGNEMLGLLEDYSASKKIDFIKFNTSKMEELLPVEEGEFLKINSKPNIKTKSQLTSIWNEANKTKQATKPAQPLDSLAQEARKYKTAEEFVKGQGETMYRGGTDRMTDSGKRFETGVYLSDLKTAKQYDSLKDKKGVSAFVIPKNSNVYKADNVEGLYKKLFNEDIYQKQSPLSKGFLTELEQYRMAEAKIAQKVKSLGYDVIEYVSDPKAPIGLEKRKTIVALTPDKIKTKSQLTSIWNEANKTKQATKPAVSTADDLASSISKAKAEGDKVPSATATRPMKPVGVQDAKSLTPDQNIPPKKISETGTAKAQFLSKKSPLGETPPSAIQKETPTASRLKLLKQDQSLDQGYTIAQEKAIINASKDIKRPPSVIKNFVEKAKKAKTDLLETWHNERERVRLLSERKDLKVQESFNPYLKMKLYPGKVQFKMETAQKEFQSIIGDVKKLGIDKKDISDYLQYRHAPERNLAIGERAAGMSTKEALEGMKKIEASLNAGKIKDLANRLQKLHNESLVMLKESGVISDELYKTLTTKYKNHIPLNRILDSTEDIGGALSGKGYNVKTTGIFKAKGSELEVDDIFANIMHNYEQAVLRSQKNIVDQATLAFVRENKDALKGVIEINKQKAIGKTFEGKMLFKKTNDPNVLHLFENGKAMEIKFSDPKLAIAFQGIGREKLPNILNPVIKFTHLFASLATRYNPAFALPNKIRDMAETMVYMSSQKGVGISGAGKTLAKDAKSIKDVSDYLRGKDIAGAKLYKELKELGGTTGGWGLSTKEKVKFDLSKMEKIAASKPRQVGEKLIEYVDNWNTIFEDSTRLSVYKTALDKGFSKEKAAMMAKEASIDFNQMGKGGPVINALYIFSNASIQGSVKMMKALSDPKTAVATAVVIGGSVAAINEWNDKADKDWRDKVPKWDRLNGLPVLLPSFDEKFRYFTIPVSWGLKPIKVMTDYAYDATSGQAVDEKTMMEDLFAAIGEAYNPLGGTDFISTITPTILDVPVDIGRNKSWTGAKIKPDFDPSKPEDIKYFSSLEKTSIGKTAIDFTKALQEKTGVAISPAEIKYAFDQYVGGAGRFVGQVANVFGAVATGKDLPANEYPLLSRFYRERLPDEIGSGAKEADDIKSILEQQDRQRFYEIKSAENLYKRLTSDISKDEKRELLNNAVKENPSIASRLIDIADKEKKGLSYDERLIQYLGVENGERAKYFVKKLNELKTKEEKRDYYNNILQKGLLTENVAQQMISIVK